MELLAQHIRAALIDAVDLERVLGKTPYRRNRHAPSPSGNRAGAPGRIVLAGDSAGGGLLLKTLVALRNAGLPLPPPARASRP